MTGTIPASTVPLGAAVAVALSLIEIACGTTYQPRPSGRVALVIHHAAAMYVKHGRESPIGPFAGDLEELVADSPNAAAQAHQAHTQFVIGVPAYLTGVVGVIVGVAALSGPIGWTVIGLGAATAGTGLGLMGSGFTHAVDAVNIHNDAVLDPLPPPAPTIR
jgi:hypothetical protein